MSVSNHLKSSKAIDLVLQESVNATMPGHRVFSGLSLPGFNAERVVSHAFHKILRAHVLTRILSSVAGSFPPL